MQGSIAQQNFLGRGLNLNLSGSYGGTSTTYRLGILNPYFMDTKIALGFDIYKSEKEWADYTEQKTGGDIKFGMPIMPNVRSFSFTVMNKRRLPTLISWPRLILKIKKAIQFYRLLRGRLHGTPSITVPLRPWVGDLKSLLKLQGLVGPKSSCELLSITVIFKGPWSTVFSAHGNLGYLHEIAGEQIPINERFYLGGIRTIRGFDTREVGPRVSRTTDVTDPVTGAVSSSSSGYEYIGGVKSAYFNLEYVFPLAKEAGVNGLFFFDTGNAWSEQQNYFESMRYSAGAGIRWQSPMGPLRFEWGYNLDPLEDEKQSVFEFSIGSFF